jgi:predicted AAA+ superfamily ATPase
MYIERKIDLKKPLQKKSLFLFGPRQTGKSSLIRHTLNAYKIYNLLDTDLFLQLSRQPSRLRQELTTKDKVVIIDEIQKLPELLDEIHLLIEERGIHFLLTGSSARKLRRGGVNLLGGRAHTQILHPFVFSELENFDLLKALNFGLLPGIYASETPEKDLRAYIGNYLREEIAAEGLARSIPAFSRFLEVAAHCNACLINYTKVANDAQVPLSTVREYFQILQDTLIAQSLPAWRKSQKRKAIQTAKFYFFDNGVTRLLQSRNPVQMRSPEFGAAFESYIFHELRSYVDYQQQGDLAYWRSTSNFEVDFILNDSIAIEVKGKENISPNDIKGVIALQEEKKLEKYYVVSLETRPRTVQGIQIIPWVQFLTQLWSGELTAP